MKTRYRSIDIAKGIAIIMIILCHYNQSFNYAIGLFTYFQMGCSVFFVCSGFGIAKLIQTRYTNNDKVDIKKYLVSRLQKILPLWLLAMLIVYIANTISLYLFNQMLGFGTERSLIGILSNVFLIHGFIPAYNNTVMPGGWFIGALVILYILAPLFYYLFNRTKKRRIVFVLSSVVSIVIWAIFLLKLDSFDSNNYQYFNFLNHIPCFCLGMLLYFEQQTNMSPKKYYLVLGLTCLFAAIFVWFCKIPWKDNYSNWVTAISTYFLLKYFINIKKESNRIFLIEKFGKHSYSIYLLHAFCVWTLTSFIINHISIAIDGMVLYFILMPVIVFASYCIGLLLEKTEKVLSIIFKIN